VARRGARALGETESQSASEIWRQAVGRAGSDDEDNRAPWSPEEVWVAEEAADESSASRPRGSGDTGLGGLAPTASDLGPGVGRRRSVPRTVVDEIEATAGGQRGAKLAYRIADAAHAYERERYQEARRILRSLADELPDAPAVRELYGLVLYRSGQWSAAARQLEAFRDLSGSYDQHPVLADCYRALGRYGEAERVWGELREASPSADLVAEGRIVAAGCLADQGNLTGAIAVMERSARKVAHPQQRHLRQWYVLADLYERAGDLPRARELFGRVAAAEPEAFDVRSRLRALR
jgi:tetratricopeptide (TPR) repeat protein